MLGYTDAELCYHGSGYQYIHAADMLHCAENHIRSKIIQIIIIIVIYIPIIYKMLLIIY